MKRFRTFLLVLLVFSVLFLSPLQNLSFLLIQSVKAENGESNVFGNPSLPNWLNVTVTVAGDGKSFMVDNADNLTWTFWYGASKYNSIYQNGVQIVKDELWMLQFYDGSWKDIGSSVNVFYEQLAPHNVKVTQLYTSANGDYNVTWDFHGGFRTKISLVANISVAGNYTIDWRTYIYKDYAENKTNYVKFWNEGEEEAVVFDYTDVYRSFGNITEIDVSGWFKGKRFDETFNVGFLDVGEFVLDPIFGYTGTILTTTCIDNEISGSVFTITEDGTADSITAYLRQSYYSWFYVRCAIYKHSDLSLVGETEERHLFIPTSPAWFTFTFSTPKPSLTINTDYILVAWSDESDGGNPALCARSGDPTQGHRDVETYNSFPDPLVPTHNDRKCCIYCTYTTEEEDTTAPTYSDVGKNTTLAGQPCLFHVKCTDETGLATTGGYIYGTNNSGTPTNDTWLAFSANPDWANVTKVLNTTIHIVVQWWVYFNDTSNNWNNTGTQSFQTTTTFQRSTDQPLTVQPVPSRQASYTRVIPQPLQILLEVMRQTIYSRLFNQAFNIIAEVTRKISLSRGVSQKLTVLTETSRQATFYRLSSQFLTIITEATRKITLSRTVPQKLSILTTTTRKGTFARLFEQMLPVQTEATRKTSYSRTANLIINIKTEASILVGKVWRRTINQILTIKTEASRTTMFKRLVNQPLQMLLSVMRKASYHRTVNILLRIKTESTFKIPSPPPPPPPPPPWPPLPYMRLDLIIEKPAMISYLWWRPTFTAEILVINKGTVADDVTFQWMLLDENNVKIAGGTQTVFISGLDKKQVYLDITTPKKTGTYTLHFQSIAPLEVKTESSIEVATPFYGSIWLTVIIVIIAISITTILVVKKQRLKLVF